MSEELKLYIKEYGDRKEYEYGPSWKAMKLMMDGGYPTPEKAKEPWALESLEFEDLPPEDAPDFGTTVFEFNPADLEWRCTMCLGPVSSNYKWCPHCGRKRRYE